MKKIKHNILSVVALAMVAFAATSCTTSQSALSQLRTINNRIQTYGSTYTANDWKNTAEDYYNVDKKIAKYSAEGKYSNAEINEIGQLQSQCVKGFKNGVTENLAGKAGTAIQFVKGIIEGWTK